MNHVRGEIFREDCRSLAGDFPAQHQGLAGCTYRNAEEDNHCDANESAHELPHLINRSANYELTACVMDHGFEFLVTTLNEHGPFIAVFKRDVREFKGFSLKTQLLAALSVANYLASLPTVDAK